MVQRLPLADQTSSQPNTNLSTAISLTLLDDHGQEITLPTSSNDPFELIIPRDSNLPHPEMIPQDVTAMSMDPHSQLFNLHYVNLSQPNRLAASLHFEMHPLDANLSYLLIYRFDRSPHLNSSIQQIDGWSLLCSHLMTNQLHRYFIDNQRTVGHQSVIFGIREWNLSESSHLCSNASLKSPPVSDRTFNFTANYELRTYLSGCYYLDANQQWQSDGLLVSCRAISDRFRLTLRCRSAPWPISFRHTAFPLIWAHSPLAFAFYRYPCNGTMPLRRQLVPMAREFTSLFFAVHWAVYLSSYVSWRRENKNQRKVSSCTVRVCVWAYRTCTKDIRINNNK